ncbi:SLC13 family permease [Candidatus Neomarinimicrobiota bacterium]
MFRAVLYWISQKRWLLIAAVAATVLILLPHPSGITLEGYRTLIITVVAVLLLISETVPLPATALLIIVLQVAFGIAETGEVAHAFMSDAVFFIMGSLMLAVAIVRQGLDARLTLGILAVTGTKVISIMWGFFIITLLLTSFMGVHTIVAMLLPVAVTLIRNTSDDSNRVQGLTKLLVFAVVYGAIMGSFGTPSGGARNVIMIGYLHDFGIAEISYLKWMIMTYPLMLAHLPIGGWVLSRTFRSEHDDLSMAVQKLREQVAKTGDMTGQQLLAIALFVLIFLSWIFLSDQVGIGIIALAGVFLYLAFGLVQWQDINQRTNWGVVLLYASAITLGIQIKETGAAVWMAQGMVQAAGVILEQFVIAQYAVVAVLTTLVVNVMSPSATVAVLGPMFMNLGGDPLLLGMETAVASAFGYLTAVGSTAGMIAASTGLIKPADFIRAGWRFAVMSIVLLILALLFYWPLVV